MSTMGDEAGSSVAPKARRKLLIPVVGAALLAVIAMAAVTLGTARHWQVVDRPEQPETFLTQEFKTGENVVMPDSSGVALCRIGQDWNTCVNLVIKDFNRACVNVELAESATEVCDHRRSWIQKEKKRDTRGYTVSSLGSPAFARYPLTDVRRVSNHDYRAAETHQAVCYLGFLGECEDTGSKAEPVNEEYETGVYLILADGKDYCDNLSPKDCYAGAKAEYAQTCKTVEKTELTKASWNICRGAANELREKPTKKDKKVGSWYSAFGHLTKVPVTAVRPATATRSPQTGASPSEPAEEALRRVLKSPETEKMRATYKEGLAQGKTQDDLVSQIKEQLSKGLIEDRTACVMVGLVYDLSDDVIVEDCLK